MRTTNRFTKGSGMYKCTCCGRSTRDTGRGDNENVLMCAECYDMGGIENLISDGQFDGDAGRAALITEIRNLAESIRAAGGVPQSEYL